MNDRLQQLREKVRTLYYKKFRTADVPQLEIDQLLQTGKFYSAMSEILSMVLKLEKPIIPDDENFFYIETLKERVNIDWSYGRRVENITCDWEMLLDNGLVNRIKVAEDKLKNENLSDEAKEFLVNSVAMMRSVADFAEKYADAAEQAGNKKAAELLRKVPFYPAETLHEALQSIYFMFSIFYLTGVTLQGFGRMDQYLLKFYRSDLANGILTAEEAKELLTEFFIVLNRNNDLYGMLQQGDDGESLMLGGCTREGECAVNELTYLLLQVARDVSMINPKINLRVDKNTPDDLLVEAAKLTAKGLGFPQYSNDDIVIGSLQKFGYPLEDARDYTVAACWEFVVKNGRDLLNPWCVNFALAAEKAIHKVLRENLEFEDVFGLIRTELQEQFEWVIAKGLSYIPNPLFSAFMGKCLEKGKDLQFGGGEHNYWGMLSCGASTAVDSLAAVKKYVYDEQVIDPIQLVEAIESNYENNEELRLLLKKAPHLGDNDELTNCLLKRIYDLFADSADEVSRKYPPMRIRPGSGSASMYAVHAQSDTHKLRVHATANGRKDREYFSASLSPSPGVKSKGVLSLFNTFKNIDYERICNGGPITVELTPTYFKDESSLAKTAQIIRAFVKSNCQQLQMNILDKEVLLDAQKHPENYRDLIVRVWGWSGYFVELDKMFQDHIIGRSVYGE